MTGALNNMSGMAMMDALYQVNPELADYEPAPDEVGQWEQLNVSESAARTHRAIIGEYFGTKRNFLLFNFLSVKWHWTNVKANPCMLPLYYVGGMIGYALSLIPRIIIFAVTLFKLITTFFETLLKGEFSAFNSRMKYRGMIFLGATGELVSGTIGVVCPPIAYKMDEWIQSNNLIHHWYANSYLSFWSHEIDGVQVTDGEAGFGGSTLFGLGNEDRLQLKKERVKEELKFYKTAHEQIGQYLSEREISIPTEENLPIISAMGFLNAMQNGTSLSTFKDEAIEKATAEDKVTKQESLEKHEGLFLKYWDTLSADANAQAKGFFSYIPFFGESVSGSQFEYKGPVFEGRVLHDIILFEMIMKRDLLTDDAAYFQGGIEGRQKMQDELMKLYFKEGIVELYEKNAEVRKQVDGYFGTINGFEVLKKELEDLRSVLKGPQPTTIAEARVRAEAEGKVSSKVAELRGKVSAAYEAAGNYCVQNKLLTTVTFEGKEVYLRDVMKAMTMHLYTFANNWSSTDREMLTVVSEDIFGEKKV